MDEYSSRRTASGLVVSRKGPGLVLRDSAETNKDRSTQVCSKAGCSSKLNPIKGTQVGSSPNKAKTLKTPFRSSVHGKEIIGSSSRTPPAVNTTRKPFFDKKKKSSFRVETDSETSSLQEESEEVSESITTSEAEATSVEAGSSSSSGPTNRLVKRNSQRFGPSGSSTSFAFKQANQGARNGASSTSSRYNLRSLRCNNSISDVVQSGCSSSPVDSGPGRKRDVGRKRIGEPESSLSARGKKINGPMLDDRRNESSNRGISISESRRPRNSGLTGDNEAAASVRTRRSNARPWVSSYQETRNRLPLVESPLLSPSSRQPDVDASAFSLENQFSGESTSNRASSFGRPGSGSDHIRPNRSMGPIDVGIARSFMNRDTLRQYNLDGIAEMLLALERIEQEEEPSYEHLLVLETNLFLGGLAFHDQHRDMRLDIDNMSYEELLALEERIGTVSTGVPDEDLAKCLKRSICQSSPDCRENEDDVKCSICQEEYGEGEEVGRLSCDHRYHVDCINQWLRLKNWCPICKTAAAPSASPP